MYINYLQVLVLTISVLYLCGEYNAFCAAKAIHKVPIVVASGTLLLGAHVYRGRVDSSLAQGAVGIKSQNLCSRVQRLNHSATRSTYLVLVRHKECFCHQTHAFFVAAILIDVV